jgi:uncharacterized membrane protein
MPTLDRAAPAPAPSGGFAVLGFSLGGFFDGIVLHQVLQWHHLLSGVQALRDLRVQLLADGLFHALMYLLAVVGLAMLWRGRAGLAMAVGQRRLWGWACLGFATWHGVDALLSHWLLGIHRVRMDVAQPLAWDLGWLALFGLLPAALGLYWVRGPAGGGGGLRRVAGLFAACVVAAGAAAAWPGGSGRQALVVFGPGVAGAAAFDALSQVEARILWSDRSGGAWVVDVDRPGAARELYRRGAWWVADGAAAATCASWLARTAPVSPAPSRR